MYLSLWTIESRELVDEWSSNNFEKISIEVISSWQNMHQFASERGQKITSIKGEELCVYCTDCHSRLYIVLLASCVNGIEYIGDTVVQMAAYLVTMMADIDECTLVADYRTAIADCGWSLMSLLTTASQPYPLLPWSLLSATPQNVLAHMSPLMKTCLHDSLPSGIACLVSRDRILASSHAWDLLPPIEQICLTLFCRAHATISDCIVRLTSQPDKPLYRFIQIELVPEVGLLMLCGSGACLDKVRENVTKYWGGLIDELRSFEPQIVRYAPLNSVPESLCSFFQVRHNEGQCTSGHMRTDMTIVDQLSIDETMKRLYLRSRDTCMSVAVNCTVIADKEKNITFVFSQDEESHRSMVVSFRALLDGIDARRLSGEVAHKIECWLTSNRQRVD